MTELLVDQIIQGSGLGDSLTVLRHVHVTEGTYYLLDFLPVSF